MATTQRNMTFNAIADAVCLLCTEVKLSLRYAPGHSYYGSTENRGKGGKGGKGDRTRFQGECWNCGIAGHRTNECRKPGGGASKGKGKGKGKGTSMAMSATVRGETLNTDDRLDQIEDLLAKFEIGLVATSYNSEDSEDYEDDGDDGESLPYDGEDNDTNSDDGAKADEHSDEGADDGEDEEFCQFRRVSVPLLEDSSDDDCSDDDGEDDENGDDEFIRPYYCDARKLEGCPICDDGIDGRCDNCVEQFRLCRCAGRGCKPIEFFPKLTMQLNEEPGAFRARGGRVPPMEVDYTDGH